MNARERRIVVVSHDAGGAEILSSYCRKNPDRYEYVVQGPARDIFERKVGFLTPVSIDDALDGAGLLLCGTSWKSDLEFEAISAARSRSVKSIAFLDHWVHYSERFTRNGQVVLPDVIRVGDEIAERIAKESFPEIRIELIENPYFEDIMAEISAAGRMAAGESAALSVLFVSEPIGDHAAKELGSRDARGYVEEEALGYFVANRSVLGKPVRELVIRPHPSEARDKYALATERFDLPVSIGGQRTLVEEILDSDVVVGCQSMAMVVALMAGKRVICCIPPGGMPCSLPQPGIEHLQQLVGN